MLLRSSETNSIPKPPKCCPIRLLSDIRRTEYVCSDSTIISTYVIVLQLQYTYVISRFTSHYVTKKILRNKSYTYILYTSKKMLVMQQGEYTAKKQDLILLNRICLSMYIVVPVLVVRISTLVKGQSSED